MRRIALLTGSTDTRIRYGFGKDLIAGKTPDSGMTIARFPWRGVVGKQPQIRERSWLDGAVEDDSKRIGA